MEMEKWANAGSCESSTQPGVRPGDEGGSVPVSNTRIRSFSPQILKLDTLRHVHLETPAHKVPRVVVHLAPGQWTLAGLRALLARERDVASQEDGENDAEAPSL